MEVPIRGQFFYKFCTTLFRLARPISYITPIARISFLILYSILLAAAQRYFIYREIRHNEA